MFCRRCQPVAIEESVATGRRVCSLPHQYGLGDLNHRASRRSCEGVGHDLCACLDIIKGLGVHFQRVHPRVATGSAEPGLISAPSCDFPRHLVLRCRANQLRTATSSTFEGSSADKTELNSSSSGTLANGASDVSGDRPSRQPVAERKNTAC